jgi:hypothetical protein
LGKISSVFLSWGKVDEREVNSNREGHFKWSVTGDYNPDILSNTRIIAKISLSRKGRYGRGVGEPVGDEFTDKT